MNHTTFSSKKFVRNTIAGLAAATALLVAACDNGSGPNEPPESTELNRAKLIELGEQTFQGNCSGCHYPNGEGHSPHTPPLRHSDFLMASKERFMRIMLLGIPNDVDTATTITVNGIDYVGQGMGAIGADFSDTTLAGLLTFLRVVFNDTLATNCGAPTLDEDSNPVANCTLVPRPEAATDSVMPDEIAALRALVPPPAE